MILVLTAEKDKVNKNKRKILCFIGFTQVFRFHHDKSCFDVNTTKRKSNKMKISVGL